jgi:hypothetical protein
LFPTHASLPCPVSRSRKLLALVPESVTVNSPVRAVPPAARVTVVVRAACVPYPKGAEGKVWLVVGSIVILARSTGVVVAGGRVVAVVPLLVPSQFAQPLQVHNLLGLPEYAKQRFLTSPLPELPLGRPPYPSRVNEISYNLESL